MRVFSFDSCVELHVEKFKDYIACNLIFTVKSILKYFKYKIDKSR